MSTERFEIPALFLPKGELRKVKARKDIDRALKIIEENLQFTNVTEDTMYELSSVAEFIKKEM